MRRAVNYVVVIGMLICVFLSGCEYFIPNTSNALSQTRQEQELQKQSDQLERQTEAMEKLSDSVEKLVEQQNTN